MSTKLLNMAVCAMVVSALVISGWTAVWWNSAQRPAVSGPSQPVSGQFLDDLKARIAGLETQQQGIAARIGAMHQELLARIDSQQQGIAAQADLKRKLQALTAGAQTSQATVAE